MKKDLHFVFIYFAGTHYWTLGQRARVAGLGGGAYFIARVDAKTRTVFVVSEIGVCMKKFLRC